MTKAKRQLLSIFESLVYSSGQMFLGLLLHPYRSMQLLVKNKLLLPFVFYPILVMALFYFLLRIDFIFFVYQTNFFFSFIYQLVFFFCFYWQLALFYLWIRFSKAFHRL
jgi:hypothetical protein